MKKTIVLFCLGLWTGAGGLAAAPFQVGVGGESLQIVPPATPVAGLRLNLPFSENREVRGVDFGIFSLSDRMSALQFNLFNWVEAELVGASVGFFNNYGSVAGVQAGMFNTVEQRMHGLQLGIFNRADRATGLQLGLVNRVTSLRGVQIGIVNMIAEGPLTVFPLVNAAF